MFWFLQEPKLNMKV